MYSQAQLQNQQVIMTHLGYYRGKPDGVWGPSSIAAKQKWESSGKFKPAFPNNGMPLDPKGKLPSGCIRGTNGLIKCLSLNSDQEAELKNKHGGLYRGVNAKPVTASEPVKSEQPVVETKAQEKPTEVVAQEKADTPEPTPSTDSHQDRNDPRRKHHQGKRRRP